MIKDLAKLSKSQLRKLLPLVHDFAAWEAFILLLDHEEAKIALCLLGKPIPEELIRLSGKFEQIQQLRGLREYVTKELTRQDGSN